MGGKKPPPLIICFTLPFFLSLLPPSSSFQILHTKVNWFDFEWVILQAELQIYLDLMKAIKPNEDFRFKKTLQIW